MIDEIKNALEKYNGEWKEKNGVFEFSFTLAERKSFLSKRKLTYYSKIKIAEESKQVKFSEILVETGSGLSTGSGFGFTAESYNTLGGARQGTIIEQSNLFGKKFDYKFDYKEIRVKVEEIISKSGYIFEYQILPVS